MVTDTARTGTREPPGTVTEVLGPLMELLGVRNPLSVVLLRLTDSPGHGLGRGGVEADTQEVSGRAPCARAEVCSSESFLRLVQPLV